MPEIHVLPDEIDLPFEGEANALQVLVDGGLPIAHLCGGRARCTTCRVWVSEGLSNVSARTMNEAAMAEKLELPDQVRLACQMTLTESLSIRRLVLDETDEILDSQLGKSGPSGPSGREVEVAVLFTDVIGYTNMAEVLPPYDIVHLVNRFFIRATEAINENAGVVDNYMGDAILALFGLHGEDDPAMCAVRSGFAVLQAAKTLSGYTERAYGISFGVRVGIDYGEVVYGTMGAGASSRETVIGDTVNVASRLEAANKTTGTDMLVSQSVYDMTRERVVFGDRHELELKGKLGHVAAFETRALREDADIDN
jgi:class 3 adenylate cyclase